MSLENYTQLKVIGKGSYGEVWLCRNKKDKKQYVLKKMDLKKASKRERKAAEQEAKLLSKLKHPNIVSYKDSFETDSSYLYISMQYCEGGDLYNKLKEQKGALMEERQIVEWFVQISMALQYMHERNILHRDLKTQNIFLTKSKIIKVGDLGIARVLDSSSDMATTLIGTPYYMSPELFSNKPYNHKSDVWALGCCVYEMTTLKHAFNAKDMNSLVYKILRGKMPVMPKQYTTELVTLLRCMLHQDPDKRPSVHRILRDAYIKKNITIFLEGTKQRYRPGSSNSSRSVASRVGSASRKSSLENRPASNGASRPSSGGQGSRLNLIGGGDGPSVPRRSIDTPVPLPELEPISEHDKPSQVSTHCQEDSQVKIINQDPVRVEVDEVDYSGDSQKKGVSSPADNAIIPSSARQRRSRDVTEESAPISSRSGRNSLGSNKQPDDDNEELRTDGRSRPLPLPPKVETDSGLPVRREELLRREGARKMGEHSTDSSKSSGTSASSRDPEDLGLDDPDTPTPRSLPNLSARERRRKNVSNSIERPGSARRLKLIRPQSVRVTKTERKEEDDQPKTPSVNRGHHRQPSLADDSSSSSEETEVPDVKKESHNDRDKRRENKEMKNFICLLDTTLRMNKEDEKSDEEDAPVGGAKEEGSAKVEVAAEARGGGKVERDKEQVDNRNENRVVEEDCEGRKKDKEPHRRHLSLPGAETLGNTGRLMERIRLLRKDCMQGVGFQKLRKAYEILDGFEEDEVEPRLVDLLGKDCFDEYAGKIWQLKFCEDSAFGFKPT